jgi:hypothetical protein
VSESLAQPAPAMKLKRWRKGPARVPAVFARRLKPAEVRAITRPTALDRRFRPIDRYLRRWAVSQGSDIPLTPEEADGLPESKLSPLPPDEAIVADQIILDSMPDVQCLVFAWYRSSKPREVIARALNVTERAVYYEHKLALAYLLGRFTQAGIHIAVWEPDA